MWVGTSTRAGTYIRSRKSRVSRRASSVRWMGLDLDLDAALAIKTSSSGANGDDPQIVVPPSALATGFHQRAGSTSVLPNPSPSSCSLVSLRGWYLLRLSLNGRGKTGAARSAAHV